MATPNLRSVAPRFWPGVQTINLRSALVVDALARFLCLPLVVRCVHTIGASVPTPSARLSFFVPRATDNEAVDRMQFVAEIQEHWTVACREAVAFAETIRPSLDQTRSLVFAPIRIDGAKPVHSLASGQNVGTSIPMDPERAARVSHREPPQYEALAVRTVARVRRRMPPVKRGAKRNECHRPIGRLHTANCSHMRWVEPEDCSAPAT